MTTVHIKQFQVGWQLGGIPVLPWQDVVFSVKHSSYLTMCRPLALLNATFVLKYTVFERSLAAARSLLCSLWDAFKEPQTFFFFFSVPVSAPLSHTHTHIQCVWLWRGWQLWFVAAEPRVNDSVISLDANWVEWLLLLIETSTKWFMEGN